MSAKPQLQLTKEDDAKLNGQYGPAVQLAMQIIVRMAGVFEAKSLMDIEAAHIDSTLYMGEATLDFAERLAGLGAKVAVPTTLNVSGVDEQHWHEWAVPPDFAENAQRQMRAYEQMGTEPTWTCAPYQTQFRPKFGQQIAWGESNAISFANSVIGARTQRYPDLLDICAAITGRVPAAGLHLTENRAGQILLEIVDIPAELQKDDSFYPVLGTLMGRLADDQIPVIDGLTVMPTEDQLKAIAAAGASSGVVALFHIVGITPEAPSLEAAFQGKRPSVHHKITLSELNQARDLLSSVDGGKPDLVVLGSPHFSLAEFQQLAPLVAGKRCHPDIQFLVTSSRAMTQLAGQAGLLQPIQDFGAKLTLDTCILTTPMLPAEIQTLMTNSAKFAYYSPGLLNKEVIYGSLKDCVDSAVTGRFVRDDRLWGKEA